MTWSRPSEAERRQQREREKNAHIRSLLERLPMVQRGTYGGSTRAAIPKPLAHRNRALLDMAQNRPCLLLVPGVCNHRIDTTVACHSNLSIHGHARGRKADDEYSVWGCSACHYWLDFSRALADQKETVFMVAHGARQVLAWRLVAMDSAEPERFQRAARWALHHLDATPLTPD